MSPGKGLSYRLQPIPINGPLRESSNRSLSFGNDRGGAERNWCIAIGIWPEGA